MINRKPQGWQITYHVPRAWVEILRHHLSEVADPIEGLTDTLEGVAVQCEYATLEAAVMRREFCHWPRPM